MSLAASLKVLHVSSVWTYRMLTWAVLACGFVFAVAVLTLRYWVFPNLESYRGDIERTLSGLAHQRITIGKISGNWDGLRPELVLERVTVFDRAGKPALELARVDTTVSWRSVVMLGPRLHSLEIHQPALDVHRDARGMLTVAGVELGGHEGGGGFIDWLLAQSEIIVRDARISWHDELRGAPPLELRHVTLLMRNQRGVNHFGLRAEPPAALAAPLDLRGEIELGRANGAIALDGRLYVKLDYADIAAWRTWVPFPIEFPSGDGAIRAWITLSGSRLTEAVADVSLAHVRMRLAQDLPELELSSLAGRVGWVKAANRLEFYTAGLGFKTEKGLELAPADFQLKLVNDSRGEPLRGEIQANALALEPLVLIADRLPVGNEVRERLTALAPKGRLFDLSLRWTGPWSEPAQFNVRGRFENLALNRSGGAPGFAGLSGYIEGGERGGALYLNSSGASLDMPRVFRRVISFGSLTAQIGWARRGSGYELRFNNVAFANPDLAGNVFGTYQTAAKGPGTIDLTGTLTRADARRVKDYLPLTIGKASRAWLDNAFLGGQSQEVALRLRGDLANFPFRGDKGGIFQVVAKVTGGVLHYAPRWPRIENIAGEIVFRGERMEVNARQGTVLGVRLSRVTARIPDLEADRELLQVNGEAEGPSSAFLNFIEKSPVMEIIDRFVEGMQVQGNGRLALKLDLPLDDIDSSRVAGTYHFVNNRVVADPAVPPIEQVNGRLEFTESGVRVEKLAGVFLGGPVTLSAATARDATVRINVQGRANMDNLRRQAGSPAWSHRLRGATDWKGELVLRQKIADLVIHSSLQGIASDLPAPFTKTAGAPLPLRFERRYTGPRAERISFDLGEIVSARLLRQAAEGGPNLISRGTIRFGGAAPEPSRDGVWVTGGLKRADLDGLLALSGGAGEPGAARVPLAGIDVKIGELALIGRHFNDVAVNATQKGGVWQAALNARQFEGSVNWRPQGRGRLTARMLRLALPAAAPAPAAAPEAQAGAGGKVDWPALDIVAEQFQFRDRALGRLELVATPAEREWRIDRLVVSNPDGTLNADGVWQTGLAQPRTQVNLRLNVNDIGKMLVRLNYPEGVRRGTAKLEGTLHWPGGPQQFDYPVLSGNLLIEANKGQFVKLEPGIGKLLGILSLQSLPRRITLDFRDIFSEGFAFDEIAGTVAVDRGVASTDSLRIQGPAARVLMSGQVDLAGETQKLTVKITPSLSDSVSIAGALIGGPVAGVAAFLAQKVLKDPLDQMASYEYRVTGTWAEPQVSKIEKPAPPETDKPQ